MKWLRRTDQARRTKGDPPLTYAQLEAKVARLEEQKALLVEECNNLDTRNIHLREENRALRESNLRLINDADQLRKRLPRVETDFPPPDGAYRTAEPKLTLAAIRRIVERWPFAPDDVDPDLTRPYIPTYYEAGKDEER